MSHDVNLSWLPSAKNFLAKNIWKLNGFAPGISSLSTCCIALRSTNVCLILSLSATSNAAFCFCSASFLLMTLCYNKMPPRTLMLHTPFSSSISSSESASLGSCTSSSGTLSYSSCSLAPAVPLYQQ